MTQKETGQSWVKTGITQTQVCLDNVQSRNNRGKEKAIVKPGSKCSVVVSVFHARSQLSKACLTLLAECVSLCEQEGGCGPR